MYLFICYEDKSLMPIQLGLNAKFQVFYFLLLHKYLGPFVLRVDHTAMDSMTIGELRSC